MRSPHDGQVHVSARRACVLPYDSLENDLQQPTGELSREAVSIVYHRGLLDLVFDAAQVHRRAQDAADVQCASLLSVKTGGCPENCAYCPQSAHYSTEVEAEPLLPVEAVASAARDAKANGADRFCLGAAWREVQDGPSFDRVLEMVDAVKRAGLETCVTLGMLTPPQAARLRDAGAGLLQPQPGQRAGVLRPDHHHALLRRPPENARSGARGGPEGVLRRDPGHGREPRRPHRPAARAGPAAPATRKRPR